MFLELMNSEIYHHMSKRKNVHRVWMTKSEGKNTNLNWEMWMEDKIRMDLTELGKGKS